MAKKGKNYSGTQSYDKRSPNDLYQTLPADFELFLDRVEPFMDYKNKPILEPACGKNSMVDVFKKRGYTKITGKDLVTTNDDFFKEGGKWSLVCTNPPFRLANAFLQKSTKVAEEAIYLYLPLDYLHGQERFENVFKKNMYNAFFLDTVYIYTRKTMLSPELREDGLAKTGMTTYAFFVFLSARYYDVRIDPIFKWIDNDKNIAKKRVRARDVWK